MKALNDFAGIDKSWTLFLDRDGVINFENVGTYVTRWEDFRFMEGAQEALKILSGIFGTIVVVTNQRGIAKGLMNEQDLLGIHTYMLENVVITGGRIDKIYYCMDEGPNRKPSPGMAYQARDDFPAIDFTKSIMIGNTMSDMMFGKSVGMTTVFISSNRPAPALPDPVTDAVYPSLYEAAKAIAEAGDPYTATDF